MTNPFLYMQIVLFQTVQFSISTQFSSILPLHRTLSGTTTPGLSGPGSNNNIGGTSHSPKSYPRYSLGESYLSAKMQSVYSAVPADWARCKDSSFVHESTTIKLQPDFYIKY